jgi:hypothetical protein
MSDLGRILIGIGLLLVAMRRCSSSVGQDRPAPRPPPRRPLLARQTHDGLLPAGNVNPDQRHPVADLLRPLAPAPIEGSNRFKISFSGPKKGPLGVRGQSALVLSLCESLVGPALTAEAEPSVAAQHPEGRAARNSAASHQSVNRRSASSRPLNCLPSG